MSKNKALAFIITLILSVFFIWMFESASTLPFVFPFLISACLTVCFIYCGTVSSGITVIVCLAFSYFFFDKSEMVLFSSAILTIIGVVIGYMLVRRCRQVAMIGAAAVGYLILYIGIILMTSNYLGENVITYTVNALKPYMMDVLESSLYSMRAEGLYSGVEEYLSLFFDSLILLMPSIIVILSSVMGYILIAVISIALKLLKSEHAFIVMFSRFKVDGITIIVFFASMIAGMFVKQNIMSHVFNNIYTILQFVLQICGLSLIDAYFINKKIPFIPRMMLIIAVFFASMLPVVAAVLVVLAALDANRDFRGIAEKKE